MSNPNPVEARLAKRRKARQTKRGIDLKELRVIMSDFIEALDGHISQEDGPPDLEKLKSVGYLLNQAIGSYVKLVEAGELEARFLKLQKEIDAIREEARESRIAA
jgi:hypothetical protein